MDVILIDPMNESISSPSAKIPISSWVPDKPILYNAVGVDMDVINGSFEVFRNVER